MGAVDGGPVLGWAVLSWRPDIGDEGRDDLVADGEQRGDCPRGGLGCVVAASAAGFEISLLVIGLVIVHVVATALDAMGDSVKTVLIPWQWANQGWPEASRLTDSARATQGSCSRSAVTRSSSR